MLLLHQTRCAMPPKKFDTSMNERKVKPELLINNKLHDCKEDLEEFEELFQNAQKHSFGKKKKIIND